MEVAVNGTTWKNEFREIGRQFFLLDQSESCTPYTAQIFDPIITDEGLLAEEGVTANDFLVFEGLNFCIYTNVSVIIYKSIRDPLILKL